MPIKKIEIKLTPQNEEWMKMIPNQPLHSNIILNKLIEYSIKNGLLLDVISQSLILPDLIKFKDAYITMYEQKAKHMSDLESITPFIERKKIINNLKIDEIITEQPIINLEETAEPIKINPPIVKKEKKMSNGFDEDSF